MNTNLLALHGLKWNPFAPQVPTESLLITPEIKSFCWRVMRLTRDGGFALITGEPGLGKSVALRLLVDQLTHEGDLTVGVLTRPQTGLLDFYRELGEIFGVQLSPHNRWQGTRLLRQRWQEHIESALLRPVLIIDEAQEMQASVLNELRLLCAADLDSRCLLSVVLGGDLRLGEKFRSPDLLPLGSRIRVRTVLQAAKPDRLVECLRHGLKEAGNAHLMTEELMRTVAEHAAGNYRIMMTMAGELLDAAVQQDAKQMDEKLYLELYAIAAAAPRRPRQGVAR
jgi:type II secretory pathway predicted ATPase ExeA